MPNSIHRLCLVLALAACTQTGGGQVSAPTNLEALPLDAETERQLRTELGKLSEPSVQASCTPKEIELAGAVVTQFAIYSGDPDVSEWTAAEKASMEALRARYEALGRDPGKISPECQAALAG